MSFFSTFNFFLSLFSFFFFAGNQQQLEVKVLDFCYSTDDSINKPIVNQPSPPLAAPSICTQINYIVQIKKKKKKEKNVTLLHHNHLQRARHGPLLLEPHILRNFQTSTKRRVQNVLGGFIYRAMYSMSLSRITRRKIYTAETNFNSKHTTGARKKTKQKENKINDNK